MSFNSEIKTSIWYQFLPSRLLMQFSCLLLLEKNDILIYTTFHMLNSNKTTFKGFGWLASMRNVIAKQMAKKKC